MKPEPTVFIVDDDPGVCDSLRFMMESVGLEARTFSGADAFLKAFDRDAPGCLVLDVRMPGMSGTELQERLLSMGATIPLIFLTAYGDVPMAVEALKSGAADFVQKPFRDQQLIDKIQRAIQEDARIRKTVADRTAILARIASLTQRERQVMDMVAEGKANKVIARDLGLSQRTVEIHRSRMMEKMQAASVADLVRLVMRAGIRTP